MTTRSNDDPRDERRLCKRDRTPLTVPLRGKQCGARQLPHDHQGKPDGASTSCAATAVGRVGGRRKWRELSTGNPKHRQVARDVGTPFHAAAAPCPIKATMMSRRKRRGARFQATNLEPPIVAANDETPIAVRQFQDATCHPSTMQYVSSDAGAGRCS